MEDQERPLKGFTLYEIEITASAHAHVLARTEQEAYEIAGHDAWGALGDCWPETDVEIDKKYDPKQLQMVIDKGQDEGVYAPRDIGGIDIIQAARLLLAEEELKPPPEDPNQTKMFEDDE